MSSRSQEISSSFSSNTTPTLSESITVNSPSYLSSPQTHITDHVLPINVPKLYVARIQQLKRELKLKNDGEVIYWLLKQSGQLALIKHINVPINQPITQFAPSTRRPTQITPMHALPPHFSQIDTESIEIPEIYVARIRELQINMKMGNEGEVIHWLLKEAEESIIGCTGTGTMPILFTSSSSEAEELKKLYSPETVLVNRSFRAKPYPEVIMRAVNAYPCDESQKIPKSARMRAINDPSLVEELKKAKSAKKN